MSHLSNPIFHDETKAREWLENHIWPDGPVCPHCGVQNYRALKGKSHRPGLYQCNESECRGQFTVTVGTVFERSKIPLSKWLQAIFLLSASKKGMSSKQLSRMLELPYKTAWFMTHRIREAMRPGADFGPLGGEGKIVEADETYIGGKEKNKHRSKRSSAVGGMGKQIVFSLVERGGSVRSQHVQSVSAKTLRPILRTQVDRKSTLMTDEAGQYRIVGPEFARHQTVNHGIEEYVRGNAYTNTVEGYFSIMKRGITGVYHHVSEQHLKRYLGEFDFRYNTRDVTDMERTIAAAKGISGKRLTYRPINEASNA